MSDTWTPQSPIRQECWEAFSKEYAIVWDQLVYLRTSLYLLRKIAAFPIHRFVSFDEQWFFTIVRRALFETIVLGVTKLVTDQKGDLLTLRQWRNRVLSMLRPEHETQFRTELKETTLEAAAEALANRARDLRDGKIAHLRLTDIRNGTVASLGLPDLDRLVDETERLFQPLLFGASASFLPPHYDPEVRAMNSLAETDIEQILKHFAERSYGLNEPEENPQAWPYLRQKMTPEQIQELNEWRSIIGKTPA
jgi:hypothetical protein